MLPFSWYKIGLFEDKISEEILGLGIKKSDLTNYMIFLLKTKLTM